MLVCLQLDKANADAAEYRAGVDKLTADNWEQKAQVGSRALLLLLNIPLL
jgi:hypothetical protein